MSSTIRHVTIECTDPYSLSGFWSQILGWPRHEEDRLGDPEAMLVPPDPAATPLLFIRDPDRKTGRNRLYIDLMPTDRRRDDEVQRLIELGAHVVGNRRSPTGGWVVLTDPEGNEFYVEISAGERAVGTLPRRPDSGGRHRRPAAAPEPASRDFPA